MIGYLNGNVISQNNGVIILETGGVGFEVTCSASAFTVLSLEKKGGIYTYMHVKEDAISLYGFISQEEKSMFLKLISVSGVGPKMGIMILSAMPLKDLAYIIASSDVKGLSSVKGLGKKTAERIILELREKITEVDKETGEITMEKPDLKFETENEDAIIALMGLGFTKAECVKAVKDAKSNGATTIEQLMSYALRHIK